MEQGVGELDAEATVELLDALVAPRPVAWISTYDADETANLAPYAQVMPVHHDPPVIAFAAKPGAEGRKDTPRNAAERGEFVVNLVAENSVSDATETALADGDEFAAAGIERAPASTVDPPRVADAPAHLECRTRSTHDIAGATLVVGKVMHVAVDGADDGVGVNPAALSTVGRLSEPYFTRLDLVTEPLAND